MLDYYKLEILLSPRSLLGNVWRNRTLIVKVKVTESPLGEQSNVP